eukprot:15457095-Alexandrium_andersonii.AAC.1
MTGPEGKNYIGRSVRSLWRYMNRLPLLRCRLLLFDVVGSGRAISGSPPGGVASFLGLAQL